MSTDERRDFPLGVPTNRKPAPAPTPIEGRPNWFRDVRDGHEFYREPGQQPQPVTNNPTGSKPS